MTNARSRNAHQSFVQSQRSVEPETIHVRRRIARGHRMHACAIHNAPDEHRVGQQIDHLLQRFLTDRSAADVELAHAFRQPSGLLRLTATGNVQIGRHQSDEVLIDDLE